MSRHGLPEYVDLWQPTFANCFIWALRMQSLWGEVQLVTRTTL